MNATAFKHINVSDIDSPIITRPYSESHAKSLMPSIKAEGLHQPIKVFQKGPRFILGPGMHRLMAVRMLGHKDIAAVVESYESDEQVRAAQRAENILRENMDPVEETLAIEQAVLDNANDEQRTADQLGKPLVYVQQRLALLALTPEARESLVAKRITLRHAQLLAKVGDKEEQNGLLSRCEGTGFVGMAGPGHKEREEYNPPMSTDDLADLVRTRQRDLMEAQWKLDVAFGTANRDCTGCPFNSKNRPELFVDGKKSSMTCGDGGCFDDKRTIAARRTRSVAWQICKDGIDGTPANKTNIKKVPVSVIEATMAAKETPFVLVKAVKDILPDIFLQQQGTSKPEKKATKKTAGQRDNFNSPTQIRKRTIDSALNEGLQVWKEKALSLCVDAIAKNPLAPTYLLLLSCGMAWAKAENNRLPKKDERSFINELAGAVKADANAMARVGRSYLEFGSKGTGRDRINVVLRAPSGDLRTWGAQANQLMACMSQAFKIDINSLGPKPDFTSEAKKYDEAHAKTEDKDKPKKKAKA